MGRKILPVADDVQRFCIKHLVSKTLPQKTPWISCAFPRGYFAYLLPQKVMAERGARLLVFFASLMVLRLGGADKGKFRLSRSLLTLLAVDALKSAARHRQIQ